MDLQDGKRMFGDIKSKLGFGSKSQDQSYDDQPYDDDYGYDDYADDYDDYGSDSEYDRYAPVTTRAAGTSSSSMPRLVSIDDVRASTQVPSSLKRDPLPPRHVTSSSGSSFGRTMVDSSLPPQMTPEGTAAEAAAVSRRRSEGLDSLFEPTTEDARANSGASSSHARSTAAHARTASASGSAASASSYGSAGASDTAGSAGSDSQSTYDPYDSYTGTSTGSYKGRRTLTVISPMSYGEVESVSKALKAGDVAILALRNTPDDLSKRVLDFSFGVASALDASVECIGDKVFALARDGAISEVERMNLRNQGVL